MTNFSDAAFLFNVYNLLGEPDGGSLTVPNQNIAIDTNNDYVISYSYFRDEQDVIDASYYNFSGGPAENIVSPDQYRADIEAAINSILHPTDPYSVSFSDVAKINFVENTSETGIITFAQLKGTTDLFEDASVSAVSLQYVPTVVNSDKQHGDIFINLDHDFRPGVLLAPLNSVQV